MNSNSLAIHAARRRLVTTSVIVATTLSANCKTLTTEDLIKSSPIKVVNMIPADFSGETWQNAEPAVGVHPNAAAIVAGVVADPSFCPLSPPRTRYPVFVSRDDGDTWEIACIAPMSASSDPMDMTVRFASDGEALYGAMIMAVETGNDAYFTGKARPAALPLLDWLGHLAVEVDALSSVNVLTTVTGADQPHVETAALPPFSSNGLTAAMVLKNSLSCPQGGVVEAVPDPFTPPGAVREICLADRNESTGGTPAVRMAVHPSGRAYAVFYRPAKDEMHWDVVVMRQESGTDDPDAFKKLEDVPMDAATGLNSQSKKFCEVRDGRPGYRVARCIVYPEDIDASGPFGQERRVWSQLAIAVSPANSDHVYVAWGDSLPDHTSHLRLNFASSMDGGSTWTTSPFVVENGTNPAIAVAEDGAVGTLYQQLAGDKWQTWFSFVKGDETTRWKVMLAEAPASDPKRDPNYLMYLGDYIQLVSRGKDFYGVFSTSNDRSAATFWPNTSFQREYNAAMKPASAGTPVEISIDPYFVKFSRP